MNLPRLQTATHSTRFSRLDFRAKLAVFCAGSTLAVLWDQPVLSLGLAGLTLLACVLVGIPRGYLGFMLRVMIPFFLLLLFTHGFFNVGPLLRLTGQTALTPLFTVPAGWWLVGGHALSVEGLLYGTAIIGKSLTFLLLVPLCVFTTDPNNLVVGLVRLRVPYRLAFVFSSTLRFFPLIFEEIRAVIETQRLRGFAPEEMSTTDRVRTYAKVAVPVILSAMFKAQHIEVVLQSKAFSGRAERTYLHESVLVTADLLVIVVSLSCLAAAIALYVTVGLGRFGAAVMG